jgi:hypothetical protein
MTRSSLQLPGIYEFELFRHGYMTQSGKIAGMQRPRGWSTG